MTTAIALSGGGANGDFEVGVLRFLYDILVFRTFVAWGPGCGLRAVSGRFWDPRRG
jgi:hypothetical protein